MRGGLASMFGMGGGMPAGMPGAGRRRCAAAGDGVAAGPQRVGPQEMTAAPVLTTERLTLRPNRMEDFPPFAAFFVSDAATYIGGRMDARQAWKVFAAEVGSWDSLWGSAPGPSRRPAPRPSSARSPWAGRRTSPSARSAGSYFPPISAAATPARPAARRVASPSARSAGPRPSATSTRRTSRRSQPRARWDARRTGTRRRFVPGDIVFRHHRPEARA